MALGEPRPYSKQAQLARQTRKYRRKVASPKRWQQIAEAKQGPCRVCMAPPPNQLHHLVPRSQGGADTEANIAPLCPDCHRSVTAQDRRACAALRVSLSDSEYAYANEALGEGRFEQRYPVRWEKP